MMQRMRPPEGTTDVMWWEERCRKIHTLAKRLLDGHAGVLETARALSSLAMPTGGERDADMRLFVAIDCETTHLPVGAERQY